MLLKSYILPSFNIVSQKYKNGDSVNTEILYRYLCERLCSKYGLLLDIYLEKTLLSNRKRRIVRVSGSLPVGSNACIDEAEEHLELILGIPQVSNINEREVEKRFYDLL